jgi:hypothetical protein
MAVNFRAYGINRWAHKLTRTPTLIKKKKKNNIEDIYIEQVKVTFRQNTGPVCQPRTMPQKHSVFCLRELHKEFEVTLYLNGLSTIVEKERMEQ